MRGLTPAMFALMSAHSIEKDLRIKDQSKFFSELLLGNPHYTIDESGSTRIRYASRVRLNINPTLPAIQSKAQMDCDKSFTQLRSQ